MANTKVQACFVNTIGVTASDRKKIAALAKNYSTGDTTQDYILATNDLLTYLRDAATAVQEAITAAENGESGVATMPAAPTPQEVPPSPKGEAATAAYESPEAAWEDMKPDDAPALNELSPVQQAEWIVLYENNKVSLAAATEIFKSRTKIVLDEKSRVEALTKRIRDAQTREEAGTDREEIESLIEIVETTKSKGEYRDTLADLMDWLYSTDERVTRKNKDTGKNERVPNPTFVLVKNFIDELPIDDSFREALVEFGRTQMEPIKATRETGDYNPVFNLILKAQMLDPMRQKFGFKNLPPEMELAEKDKVVVKAKGRKKEEDATDMPEMKAVALANKIIDYNSREFATDEPGRKAAVKKLTELYRAVKADGLEDFADVDGKPLSDFFTEDDRPKVITVSNKLRIVTEIPKEAKEGRIKTTTAVEDKPEDKDVYTPWHTFDNWESGRYLRDDGQSIPDTLPVGRLRMAVSNFISKLSIKPRVEVFKNQADLKEKDPELYAKAAAARPQGDFDTVSAVAYSFGGKPAPTTGVSRREFFKGLGAVVAAGKANLQGMNKKELWDEMFRLRDKVRNVGIADDYMLRSKNFGGEFYNDLETGYPNVEEQFEYAYDQFERTGSIDGFPDITSEQVSEFRREIQKALKLAEEAAKKTEDKPAVKEVPPTVIIFSDRVPTEQYLNFVLAHETLGHFGFRSLIPQDKFNALMEDIYNRSPAVQAGVDAAMSVRSMPKAEAVEEYLADFAAQLDVSLVSRIWNAIKGALNKLGVKFGDEAARYFIDQSRRYVRNGDQSAVFNSRSVIERLQAIENGFDPDDTGRFAQTQTLREVGTAAGLMKDNIGGVPMNVDEALKYFKDRGIDFSGGFDKFIGKFFSLLAFRARRNPGFVELEKVLSQGRDLSMSIKVAMKEKMAEVLNRAVTLPGTNLSTGGVTEEQLQTINDTLYAAQRYAVSKLDRKALGKVRLYSVNDAGELVPNQPEIDKFYNMGLLSFEQMRDGFRFEITYKNDKGAEVTEDVKVAGIPGLTKESIEWKGYLAARETMRDVELRLLHARYMSQIQDRDLAYREMAEVMRDKKMAAESKRFLDEMYDKYIELWTANKETTEDGDFKFNVKSMESANDFLVLLNQAILGKDTDLNENLFAYFPKTPTSETDRKINAFKAELVNIDDNRFIIQNKLKDIIVADISNDQADAYTIRSLATGYTPVLRRGEFEVRINAYNSKGERVVLEQDYRDQLAYSQFEAESEALTTAEMINKELFDKKKFSVNARNPDGQYTLMEVTLKAEAGAALDGIAAPPQLNLNEFTRGLRQFSITLPPKKLEQVIVALTSQNNRARQRLERKFVPGYDPDAIRAVSEHVEARSSTIAKVMMRPRISELMNLRLEETRKLWQGDPEKLELLRQEMEQVMKDPAASEAKRKYAKREYEQYAYMFNETNPEGTAKRGNQFYNEGSSLLQFIENNRDLNESDFGTGEVASRIRAYTSIFQLGGSLATGALNYISAITNSIPYLAVYNPQNSFGGGFGFGKSMAEFRRALSNVGLRRAVANSDLNTAEFYDEMATNPQMLTEYGLEAHEAKFIAREIREGAMIPAQSNALMETARGRVQSGAWQKAMDGFMWTFNATEQASRRAVGLAAFRMEYARRISAGESQEKAAEFARVFAVDALKLSMGEYSVLNRPPAWRTGIQSFLYMYKVFPTTSIQLFRALPRSGQVYMLASMMILAGVSGFPFAEDLEDLIDTIAQKLGFKTGSIRYEIAQAVDSVAPGMSRFVLSGAANWILPADLAGRVSLGDFVPGTGVLLAGADIGREIGEVAGPAWSMLYGVFNSTAMGVKAATSEKVTFEDWLRENPITAGRILGDSLAYMNSGAIVDRRGYVVSDEVSAAVILTRLAGFYPQAAAEQYEIIRLSTRMTDYQKEVSAGFRQAWIKAMVRNDMDQARSIVEAVNDWNDGAQGTALEIKNFEANARKALREATRPASERLLKSAPKGAREDIDQVTQLFGY
jgi:hypothetical protein